MLFGLKDKRPPWLSKSSRKMFQRGLSHTVIDWFGQQWPTRNGLQTYPSELTTPLYDVRNVAYLTSDPKFSDTTLMGLVKVLGWPQEKIENYEARARAEDAAEAYERVVHARPSEDMLLAFEAMWIAGEYKAAYTFMAAVRKLPHPP